MRAILAAIGIALLALWLAGLAAGRSDAPATPTATGDPTYTSGTFTLRLSNEPCDLEEQAAELNDRGIPPAREYYTLQKDGHWSMSGCWAKDMSGDVLTRSTIGEEGWLAAEWFRR